MYIFPSDHQSSCLHIYLYIFAYYFRLYTDNDTVKGFSVRLVGYFRLTEKPLTFTIKMQFNLILMFVSRFVLFFYCGFLGGRQRACLDFSCGDFLT